MANTNASQLCLNLTFCYLNIRSLLATSNLGLPRFELLRAFCCQDHSYDVILLSETHLDKTIDDSEIDIHGYILFRKDRNRHGGGVLIYAKEYLLPVLFADVDNANVESIFIKILGLKQPIFFGCYYRSPGQLKADREAFLESMRCQMDFLATNHGVRFYLFGDFNDRCVDWGDEHSTSELGRSLVDIANNYNVSQMITTPTRGRHILDLLLTNRPQDICFLKTEESIDNLDHETITGKLKTSYNTGKRYTRLIRHYSSEGFSILNSTLSQIPWHSLLSSDVSVDRNLEIFYVTINEAIDKVFPLDEITVRPNDRPGMTNEVRMLFKTTHRLYRIAKRTKNTNDIDAYKDARRTAKKKWRTAKDIHNKRLYCKNVSNIGGESGSIWKIIKQNFGGKKTVSIPSLRENDVYVSENVSKATLLNEYFSSQSTLDLSLEPPLPDESGSACVHPLCTLIVTRDEILKEMNLLNVNKATGADGVGNTILKNCSCALSVPLLFLFNQSLEKGIFPTKWKSANIVPVFKKGDKQDKTNYRPISLLSNISKLFEGIIYNHI